MRRLSRAALGINDNCINPVVFQEMTHRKPVRDATHPIAAILKDGCNRVSDAAIVVDDKYVFMQVCVYGGSWSLRLERPVSRTRHPCRPYPWRPAARPASTSRLGSGRTEHRRLASVARYRAAGALPLRRIVLTCFGEFRHGPLPHSYCQSDPRLEIWGDAAKAAGEPFLLDLEQICGAMTIVHLFD